MREPVVPVRNQRSAGEVFSSPHNRPNTAFKRLILHGKSRPFCVLVKRVKMVRTLTILVIFIFIHLKSISYKPVSYTHL
ncbi:hypothetical protein FA227_12000, partial [Pseudomonas aeruginosa]|nr:hypothetical protein [Pseudomonas aeruginosa]